MSRKMLITLIVVMAAVLSGLIFVQTSTIKRASDIEEEQFNQLVENALLGVSLRLNQWEEKEARDLARQQRQPIETDPANDFSIFPRNSSTRSTLSFGFSITEQAVSRFSREELTIIQQDTLGDFTLADSLAMNQIFRMQQQRRRELWTRNDSWRAHKILLEGRPVEERVDSAYLDQVLKAEIAETGIDIDFKYAIKNSNRGREVILFGDKDYNPGRRKEYPQRLFTYDYDGPKPNYLNIYFPKRSGYLIKATGLSIIPTVILTAFLIGIFVYTIMVIFRQKKLSNIKNDFINNMTHELKTPISTISLCSSS